MGVKEEVEEVGTEATGLGSALLSELVLLTMGAEPAVGTEAFLVLVGSRFFSTVEMPLATGSIPSI